MKKAQDADRNFTKPIEEQKLGISKPSTYRNEEAAKSTLLEDKMELARREAYIDPKARDLLRQLLQCGDDAEIIPTFTPGLGYVYQTTQLDAGNGIENLPRELLENLSDLDILKKSFFDSVSACPSCQSTIITFHNRCPKCRSHNVKKTSLTEHIPCGFIDQNTMYSDGRCPKCGLLLIEGQFRNMGRWYVCQDCGERFENPEFDLICRKCSKDFTIKEAQIVEVPKFRLNAPRKKEIRQNVASLEDIAEILTDLGFTVHIPGLTIGEKSGMQHHFSLIAEKFVDGQEIKIALDHAASESEVQTSPVILYIYKTSEVKVDIPIFIAIPQLSETAKKIVQGHNILLIEGSISDEESTNRTKDEIQKRLTAIIQERAAKALSETEQQEKPETSSFRKLFGGGKKKDR